MNRKGTILVVDDNSLNIDILVKLLKGYDVLVTIDGPGALSTLERETVDIVLLDVMMPGMDGFQVCQWMKAQDHLKHIPVIFLTARKATEDIVHGFDMGGVDYVTKPFKAPELLARIRTHIELKKAQEEIKSLQGILPICASCKKIRDDKGYWKQIEAYISEHSEAHFSHGICPECVKKLYPELDYGE
jgi:phosphoserine phosphatase RsbU/P